jgi:cell division protein FtsW (lipid II flippase)
MESKFDIVTTASAVWVAAYAAIAIGYVARYDLEFSPQAIRGTAVAIAVIIAALITIDFFGKKLRRAK